MLDLSNLEPAAQPVAAAALDGLWEAVIAYTSGDVTTINDVVDNQLGGYLDDVQIVIVRDMAAPTVPDAGGVKHLPDTYLVGDLCVKFENFEGIDDVVRTWVRALAMTEGLNAALDPPHDCGDTARQEYEQSVQAAYGDGWGR